MHEHLLEKTASRLLAASVVLLSASLLSCGTTEPGAAGPQSQPPYEGPTYWKDIAPIVQGKCESCHTTGGIAPFTFENYEVIKAMAPAIRQSVQTRTMPPWPPAEGCGTFEHPKSLDAEQIALISAWAGNAENPQAEGNRADAPPPLEKKNPSDLGLGAPSFVVDMPAYQPTTSENDDYHCFITDPKLTKTEDVIASLVTPGNPKIVHHVILFEVKKASVAQVKKLDDDEAGPGYTCFTGVGFINQNIRWIASWAPGGEGGRVPEDTGLRLDPGSVLVMQVHYNLLNGRGEEDQTKIDLYYSPTPVKKPALIYPFADPLKLHIPAGMKESVNEVTEQLGQGWPTATIYGAAGHMHLLGTKFSMEIERADGTKECLLDIPKWDFHWQGMYMYEKPTTIGPGDKLRMKCTYDNSRQNQPYVNGARQTPRDVIWGEGTLDEMCLGLLYTTGF